MKEYQYFAVRLPLHAGAQIESESLRTGVQKTVLLRSIILNWIAKEHGALPDINLPGLDQAALQPTPTGGMAANGIEH